MSRFAPLFSSRSFIVKPYIWVFHPFWINFCIYYKIRIQFHSFVGEYLVFSIAFIEETILSVLNILNTFVKDQLTIHEWVQSWALYSVPLSICLSLCQQHIIDNYSLVIQFEIGKCAAISLVFLAQNCFGYSGSFVVPYEYWIFFFYFCKTCHWDFHEDCIKSLDHLG